MTSFASSHVKGASEERRPVRCILVAREWGGLTHLGTSWEPRQDLRGRRRNIYSEANSHLQPSVSSTHAGTQTASQMLTVSSS